MAQIDVVKRDGETEDFDVNKISNSIMNAAIEVGGEDYTIANELAYEVLDLLESNEIYTISSEDLNTIVKKTLIENGHAKTAEAYILKSADRAKMREMDTDLMKSFEEITFTDPSESEVKRENANIDSSTAMGTMLKYGSEAAKKFNLLYLMSNDIANAHRNGDIHIHDLDFLSLTETCITADSLITIKVNDNVEVVKVEELMQRLGYGNSKVDEWHSIDNISILSNNKFVTLNKIVKHSSDDKSILKIKTSTGELNVTDEHLVSVIRDNTTVDVKASELKVGDVLSVGDINLTNYSNEYIDIIDIYTGDNLVIANTYDIIADIKDNGNWKSFCNIYSYKDKRGAQIRAGQVKMTISEYKKIEHLTSIKHSDLKIQYKRSRGNETICAVIPLTFELGNFIGLMYSEGSFGEYEDPRQDSLVKSACFCNYDEDLIQQFNRNYSTVFNNAVIRDRKHKGRHTGSCLSGYLQYELFQGVFGVKASTNDIRLADWMFSANKSFVNGLLAGIIDGDGTVQKDGYRVMIGSISLNMLTDIQKLLLLRGIKSIIKKRSGAEAGTVTTFINDGLELESVRHYDNYILEFTGDLSNKLGWINSNKINSVDLATSNKFRYKLETITEITEIEYDGYVYDMETEDHHFTVNGFNVHNCCQIPLDTLFKNGFNTGHGFLREPGNIRTAGALAAIAIQSNQNDQHGGQSVPMFDYYLAPYVALSYAKTIAHVAKIKLGLKREVYNDLKSKLVEFQDKNKLIMSKDKEDEIKAIISEVFSKHNIKCSDRRIKSILSDAYDDTYDETFQSMEAFVHNLNTMHCLPASEKIWVLDVKTNEFKSITMEELDNEFEEKRFKVISLNKKTGKSEFKFITHCKKLDNNRDLVKITDNQGRTVTVTDNHRIMTIDGINITEDIPENCEYTLSPRGIRFPAVKYDLCVSDYGKPRSDNPFKNDHIFMDEHFAEFIGYYMADGCMLGNTSTCCISACGKVTFSYMEDLIKNTFGVVLKTSYTYYKNSKYGKEEEKDIRIQLGMPLARMINDKFGRTCHEKKIPVELMFAPESVRKAFLKAYFKLDGRNDRNYAELSTVNKELQAQVAFMLSSLGVSSHYTTRSCSNGFDCTKERDDLHFITLSGHDAYQVDIRDDDNTAFEIPKYYLGNVYDVFEDICSTLTSNRASKNLRYSELSELVDSYEKDDVAHLLNIFANKIVMKEHINSGDEYVYDISVEDNENFLTYECIFVHNSRAGRRANMVDVPVTWETLCSAV